MAMNNTSTKKVGVKNREPIAGETLPTKDVNYKSKGGMYTGQLKRAASETFAEPMNKGVPAGIKGLEGTHNDIGELSGFVTDGYLDKGDAAFGEDAKFNFLPPGMDISNQENAEIHEMPLRILVEASYPGDGWMPHPRDVEE